MPSFQYADKRYLKKLSQEPEYVSEMLNQGKDPRDRLIADCTPLCSYWKEKLERCESKLEQVLRLNPSKSCLYPMRDLVTCIDHCVQPTIFHHLKKSG
jgi:ubiquinol-cytochrome c reductase subunit 6